MATANPPTLTSTPALAAPHFRPPAERTVSSWTLRLPRRADLPGDRRLELASGPHGMRVMGIVNLTPDSFSDGGRFSAPEQAVEHGLALLAAGADLLDLGAESTRPGGGVYGAGARTVPAEEELDRLLPVLIALRRETAAPLSVDTRKGAVAQAALAAGADLINDVSNLADPALGRAVAAAGCPLILMHSRGELAAMQAEIHFADLLAEVSAELVDGMERALALGIDREQLVLDPGIGFGKTVDQNLRLVGQLDVLAPLGRPLLLGASRKSFLARLGDGRGLDRAGDWQRRRRAHEGAAPGQAAPEPAPPDRRLGASLAAVAWAATNGAAMVRVHDVFETVQFLAAWTAILETVGEPR